MNRSIFTVFAVMILFWAGSLQAQDVDTKGVGDPMPHFEFKAQDGSPITMDNLKKGAGVIVFYFDPHCDHCQQEAKWMNEKAEMFKGVNMIWASWGEMEDILEFQKTYFPNADEEMVHFCQDAKFEFDNYFGYSEIPSVYVYNKKWTRTAGFHKETEPNVLFKYLLK